jgi:signal transduction histidine kinase
LGLALIHGQSGQADSLIEGDFFDGGTAVYDASGVLLQAKPASEGWEGLISRDFPRIVADQQPVYSDVIRSPVTGESALLLAVPLLDTRGKVLGVAVALSTLATSTLIRSFAAFFEMQSDRSGYAYLVDGKGKFIYHRNSSLRGISLAGTVPLMRATYGLSGATLTRDAGGERVIAGYAPVGGTRWALITRESWEVIVGPVRLYSLLLLAVLVVGGAATALLVLFAVGRVLKPIRELTEGAERIAAGQFEHPIIAVTGDEIEDLASQFNKMADSLKSLYGDLEQRVESRTREVLEQQRQLAVLEERSRVARDLHDSVSQSLYSVTLFAEAARRHLGAANSESAGQSLDQLIAASRSALKEMRLMVFELRPSELDEQGLIGALRQRLNMVEKRAGMDVQMETPPVLSLPKTLEQELYSLAQEALNNALRHANARSLLLRLRRHGAAVELVVQDDGGGFDPDTLPASGGVGIRGMNERVEKLGGRLVVESAPGQGTMVQVRIPTEMGGQA